MDVVNNLTITGTGRVPIIPSLHPSIALRNVSEKLKINLCGPFEFDIDQYAQSLKTKALESITRHSIDRVITIPPSGEAPPAKAPGSDDVPDEAVSGSRMDNIGKKSGIEMALVLEYLGHEGMDKVAGLMKRDIRQRRLFDAHITTGIAGGKAGKEKEEKGKSKASSGDPGRETDEAFPPSDDAGAAGSGEPAVLGEANLSIGARYRLACERASQNPLGSVITVKHEFLTDTLQPRLAILDFVEQVFVFLNSAGAAQAVDVRSSTSTPIRPGTDVPPSLHTPDLIDIIAHGRRLESQSPSWPRAPIFTLLLFAEEITSCQKLLAEAFGLLALSHPLPEGIKALWASRRAAWIAELHEAIGRDMGMGDRTLLEGVVRGTEAVMRVLREKGDGVAACVGVEDVR